jgi:hypothetical protein
MTWNYKTSNLATYVAKIKNKAYSFLQKEDRGYLLLENNRRILLSQDYQNKSSNTTSWTYK